MGAINKITANQLMRIAGVSAKQYKKVPWHTTTLTIRQLLPAKDFVSLIKDIITDCESPEGELKLELLDFSIRVNIITAYALSIELPKEPDDLYYIAYASDLYKTVCSNINQEQLTSVLQTVDLYVRG